MVFTKSQVAEFEEVVLDAFNKESFIASISASITNIMAKQINIILENQMKNVVSKYEERIKEFNTEIQTLKNENEILKKQYSAKVDSLEQYSRRNNICIFGVPENNNEDVEEIVNDIIINKMKINLPSNYIDACHRVGKKTNTSRPIIVKFISNKYKNIVYYGKSNLKKTKIIIKEDLTTTRYECMKKLLTTYGVKNVWSRNGEIFYKNKDTVHRQTLL